MLAFYTISFLDSVKYTKRNLQTMLKLGAESKGMVKIKVNRKMTVEYNWAHCEVGIKDG